MVRSGRARLSGPKAFVAAVGLCCAACGSTTELGTRHAEDGGRANGGTSSDGAAPTGAPEAGVRKDQLVTALIHALCDNVQRCCASVGRAFSTFGCEMTVEEEIALTVPDAMLAYDPVEAARCVQAVAAAAEACTVIDVRTCLVAFTGPLPVGAACEITAQCAAGSASTVCALDGHCVELKRGALGDACMLTCIDGMGENPTCSALWLGSVTTGAACHSRDSLVCVPAPDGTATCQPSSTDCRQIPTKGCPAGQVCNTSSDRCEVPAEVGTRCTTSLCDPTAYCDDGVCALKKPRAAACTADAECESNLCERGSCGERLAVVGWCGGPIN